MKKLILLFVVVTGLLTSCYKKPENGVAKITIYTPDHYRVEGATVELTGPGASYINISGTTNFDGEWIYTHDPALEVILNVYAYKMIGSTLYEGHGIIRIRPDNFESESYTIYP